MKDETFTIHRKTQSGRPVTITASSADGYRKTRDLADAQSTPAMDRVVARDRKWLKKRPERQTRLREALPAEHCFGEGVTHIIVVRRGNDNGRLRLPIQLPEGFLNVNPSEVPDDVLIKALRILLPDDALELLGGTF